MSDVQPPTRAAIHRVGKVWMEDDQYKLEGWWMAKPPGMVERPPTIDVEMTGDGPLYSFLGWPIAELAELSLQLGEGTWLAEPLVSIERIPPEQRP